MFSYSDDALWSSFIDQFGLEGVSAANAVLDSNKVAFSFQAVTNCDEFLSGSTFQTVTDASDPCADGNTSTGLVDSPPLIINGADPADNAQLLVIVDPEELNCMASVNTFGVTAINVSDDPTSDVVVTCITLPQQLNYMPGSATINLPTGFAITDEVITTIGSQTEVCFTTPQIGVSQSMNLTFDAAVDEMAACGDVPILVDIKSIQEDLACSSGPACDVFVQNRLNPSINLSLIHISEPTRPY